MAKWDVLYNGTPVAGSYGHVVANSTHFAIINSNGVIRKYNLDGTSAGTTYNLGGSDGIVAPCWFDPENIFFSYRASTLRVHRWSDFTVTSSSSTDMSSSQQFQWFDSALNARNVVVAGYLSSRSPMFSVSEGTFLLSHIGSYGITGGTCRGAAPSDDGTDIFNDIGSVLRKYDIGDTSPSYGGDWTAGLNSYSPVRTIGNDSYAFFSTTQLIRRDVAGANPGWNGFAVSNCSHFGVDKENGRVFYRTTPNVLHEYDNAGNLISSVNHAAAQPSGYAIHHIEYFNGRLYVLDYNGQLTVYSMPTPNSSPDLPTNLQVTSQPTDTTPNFSASVTDPDPGEQIKGRFHIRTQSPDSLIGTVDSAFRSGDGVVTAEYASALPAGQYKVQVKAIDDDTAESSYTSFLNFNITQSVTPKDLQLKWDLKKGVVKDLGLLWDITQGNQKDLGLLWNVKKNEEKYLTLLWNLPTPWREVADNEDVWNPVTT